MAGSPQRAENSPPPEAPPPHQEKLETWKEIAAYLRRAVRTVRRWEREEGLPVHRHLHKKLGTVYAYKSQVDAWWASRRAHLEAQPEEAEEAPRRRGVWLAAGAVGAVLLLAAGYLFWRQMAPAPPPASTIRNS